MTDKIQKEYGNPKHTFVAGLALDTPVSKIIETIEKERIYIVVMGTHGATGVKEIFFGLNTVHVIKRANIPVISI